MAHETHTETVQPEAAADGTTMPTEAAKETAYTWKPFVPDDPPFGEDDPETAGPEETESAGNDTGAGSALKDL